MKLAKETHASNILALKGKISEQKKDIENLLSSEKLLKAQQVDEKKERNEMLLRKKLNEDKLSTELRNAQKALLAREEELKACENDFGKLQPNIQRTFLKPKHYWSRNKCQIRRFQMTCWSLTR